MHPIMHCLADSFLILYANKANIYVRFKHSNQENVRQPVCEDAVILA